MTLEVDQVGSESAYARQIGSFPFRDYFLKLEKWQNFGALECTPQLILMDPCLLCQFRRRSLDIAFHENNLIKKITLLGTNIFHQTGKGISSTQVPAGRGYVIVLWRVLPQRRTTNKRHKRINFTQTSSQYITILPLYHNDKNHATRTNKRQAPKKTCKEGLCSTNPTSVEGWCLTATHWGKYFNLDPSCRRTKCCFVYELYHL